MEALDSDHGLLRAQGRVAARDIVQFVEMRKFKYQNGLWNRHGLAKEVLAEVPDYGLNYLSCGLHQRVLSCYRGTWCWQNV